MVIMIDYSLNNVILCEQHRLFFVYGYNCNKIWRQSMMKRISGQRWKVSNLKGNRKNVRKCLGVLVFAFEVLENGDCTDSLHLSPLPLCVHIQYFLFQLISYVLSRSHLECFCMPSFAEGM